MELPIAEPPAYAACGTWTRWPAADMDLTDWGSREVDFQGLPAAPRALNPDGLPCESARLVMQGCTFAGYAVRRKREEGQNPFSLSPRHR